MSSEASRNKATLRQEIRSALKALSPADRAAASLSICKQISELNSPALALFAGTPTEPDLLSLIGSTRTFFPKVTSESQMSFAEVHKPTELSLGTFGIREPQTPPTDPSEIHTLLCPGLAFTSDGQRLGQGGGYYDRFIPQLPSNTKIIGICFKSQLLEHLPTDPHDQPVHKVIFA